MIFTFAFHGVTWQKYTSKGRKKMNNEKWYLIPSYTMKCRIYPNKKQTELLEKALYGLKVAYNAALYDMYMNHANTTETRSTKDNSKFVHYADFDSLCDKTYLDELREKYPIVKYVKSGAMSTNNGIFHTDMKRSLTKNSQNKTKNAESKGLPLECFDYKDLHFYSKKKPRKSLTFQVANSNFHLERKENQKATKTKNIKEHNRNVLYCFFEKFSDKTKEEFGDLKIRGWNKNIRFDENGNMDFIDYLEQFRIDKKRNNLLSQSAKIIAEIFICPLNFHSHLRR